MAHSDLRRAPESASAPRAFSQGRANRRDARRRHMDSVADRERRGADFVDDADRRDGREALQIAAKPASRTVQGRRRDAAETGAAPNHNRDLLRRILSLTQPSESFDAAVAVDPLQGERRNLAASLARRLRSRNRPRVEVRGGRALQNLQREPFLNQSITFLAIHGYSKSKTLWGVAFALGHPLTAGMSMLEAGRMLGCTKQAISKIAMDFLEHTGLPPSSALKSEEAKSTYKLTNGNRKQKPDSPDNVGSN